MLLPLIAVLLNIVILSTTSTTIANAQQPPLQPASAPPPQVLQPPSQIAAIPITNNIRPASTPSDPKLQSWIPPTKPPLVQLPKVTASQPADSILTPVASSPAPNVITIDVSQPPKQQPTATPALQEQPQTSQPQIISETPSIPLRPSSSNPSPRLSNLTLLTEPSPTTATTPSPTSSTRPIDILSESSATIVIKPTTTSAFAGSTTTATSTTTTTTTTTTPAPALPSEPPNGAVRLPNRNNQPTRSPDSRRLLDQSSSGPTSSSAQPTQSTPSSDVRVQFLKPKSKFKCLQPADCLNGGICMNGNCFCAPGYTGESCSINIDECRQTEEPCSNNGICVDEVNQFRCECAAGFKGDRCQESVDMCSDSPCLNGALCINHRTDYSCECRPGWEGRHCEKNIDECLKRPCQNNATCLDLENDYKCDCGSSGFTGKNCDVDFDDCANKPCGFGAKECIDMTGDFKCICYDGFTGKKCDTDIDECQSNPCENNGKCIEKSSSIPHSQNFTDLSYQDIKEQNLSAIINMSQYAGYTCECKEEYYGDRCEEKKKCYTKSAFELCNHQQAECVNVGSSYECLINASFDGSGNNYAVYRVIGEFKMREIYIKYRSLTGGIIMSFETTQLESPITDIQINKSGLYLGGAPIKRDENTKLDELLDGNEREIRLGLETPIEIKAFTLTRPNNMNELHSAFKGCLMQVRLNNHLVPLVDYNSGMNRSFEMTDGRLEVGQCHTCFDKDCLNRGHCEPNDGYDHCSCPETFTGNFCEIDVNECEKDFNLCSNGGTCENFHGGHRCICKDGYRGEKCQEIFDVCKAKQPCANSGTCKNVKLGYQCECPSSHFGKRCEHKRDCNNECHNQHAQCIGNITCACLPGRREERIMCEYVSSCEQIVGELCLNGGTCKNLETGGYQCLCLEPFYGPICQFLIEKPQFDLILLIVITCVGFLMAACAVVSLVIFRSVRKARATRGTYSPSTQEKFGNSASDLLKPPQPERLI